MRQAYRPKESSARKEPVAKRPTTGAADTTILGKQHKGPSLKPVAGTLLRAHAVRRDRQLTSIGWPYEPARFFWRLGELWSECSNEKDMYGHHG